MKNNPDNVSFTDAVKVAGHFFGESRQKGSHVIYNTNVKDDPIINLQNKKGKAKDYQVKQLLKVIEKIEGEERGND